MSKPFEGELRTEVAREGLTVMQAEADRLKREHGELKARLVELNSRVHLSPAEELERKQIQKLKLAKKDRLAALMVSYSGTS